jgi:hypothetical protein
VEKTGNALFSGQTHKASCSEGVDLVEEGGVPTIKADQGSGVDDEGNTLESFAQNPLILQAPFNLFEGGPQ